MIVASFVLAPVICWLIAPTLRAQWSREQTYDWHAWKNQATRPYEARTAFAPSADFQMSSKDEFITNKKSKPRDLATPKSLAGAARASPTTVFESPEDVVASDDLTRKELVEVLDQWEADAEALQTATDEGMSGGKRPRLDEVKVAQTDLDANASLPSKLAPETKSWSLDRQAID